MANKTEKPTAKRLKEAAEKGNTLKSKDFVIACIMLFGVLYITNIDVLLEIAQAVINILLGNFDNNVHSYSLGMIYLGFKLALPFICVCILSGTLPVLFQIGFRLATKAIKFNLQALNPVSGFKKIFSIRTIKEFIKVNLYVICFSLACYFFWENQKRVFFAHIHDELQSIVYTWRELIIDLIKYCLGSIVIVIILDYIAEYFIFMKDMMMDKQEVKREYKENEGDPEIKSRRRQLHQEILSEQVKSDIGDSLFILANPTHISVGIYFNPEISPIPLVSVRETDEKALAVRKYATEIGVPVINDKKLARKIYFTHKRYSYIQLSVLDEIIRIVIWLNQVEQAYAA
ncbi:TPA: EscU/YscU/HrcU family type III secretion system export apparatus switch protein, partial [Escherichia coli]